jgi:hypothetical protein
MRACSAGLTMRPLWEVWVELFAKEIAGATVWEVAGRATIQTPAAASNDNTAIQRRRLPKRFISCFNSMFSSGKRASNTRLQGELRPSKQDKRTLLPRLGTFINRFQNWVLSGVSAGQFGMSTRCDCTLGTIGTLTFRMALSNAKRSAAQETSMHA